MNRSSATAITNSKHISGQSGEEILKQHQSNELFIAVVGPAGAGSGTAAKLLSSYFSDASYQTTIVKASLLIRRAAEAHSLHVPAPDERKSIKTITTMQDRGDDFRQGNFPGGSRDYAAVARFVLKEISNERARLQGKPLGEGDGASPDGGKRAYIIDSLRHPAEAHLLRRVYHDAFTLIGVVCDPAVREKRIRDNLFDRAQWGAAETRQAVQNFLKRDEDAPEPHGQHVSDTFHEADFFVDNSKDGQDDLQFTGMNDQLKRFVSLVTHSRIVRPTTAETAMHHARSAQMRSACLSRQVGASLVDAGGNVVSTGTNEVPKAGGGVYGEGFGADITTNDHRCAFRDSVYCSSNKEQNQIIKGLISAFPELLNTESEDQLLSRFRKTPIGGLLEFSRAVHAEMDAILSAATSGISPRGCRLYVTTYPCHYCARHIVAAGIDEVQFIEPYPKSKATHLHSDAITTESEDWLPPSTFLQRMADLESDDSERLPKVLFRPFVGVAPRMYRRVFLKDRAYKDKVSGDRIDADPDWGGPLDSYSISYVDLERKLGVSIEPG